MIYYPPRFLFRRQEILRRIERGIHFLEIGPGNLILTQDLLRYFDHGTLVDFNPDVEQCYANLAPVLRNRLKLIIADFATIAPTLSTFDCILACEVMEHIEDDASFLAAIHRLLHTQGQLILSVPSRMKYWSRHDETVGHIRRYEAQNVQQLFAEQGFTDVQIISYGFPFLNLLRVPRILFAYWQYRQRKDWSQKQQTQKSGLTQSKLPVELLGLICNPITVYPFSLLAALFNQYDLSDGYIITATKRL